MSDNKRYYYLKLKDNFFDTEEIKILESLPNGIFYSNLLIKLYLKSLKFNGALRFNDFIPYDENMIATITNLNIDVVRSGLKVLSSMKLIERLDDGTMYMMSIQSFIGKSSSEADRKRLYREQIEEEKLMLGQKTPLDQGQMSEECPDISPSNYGTFLVKRPPEIENRDRERDRDKELERETEIREKELKIEQEKDAKVTPKDIEIKQQLHSMSVDLLKYFENTTGLIGGLNFGAIKVAISKHGYENVKKAINRALEKNKPTMIYINGILRNWAKEGYPKEGEGIKNGSSVSGRGKNTTEYMGFKPQGPRQLSDEERKEIESELL
ncbi:phage replisome organizer N-terminal domain-containing protein [Clostridium sp.]|uniref:phage replisome organizer N-terminal domain-containing protein n=1 Tax=Clostridium sp. TaxID=1506 RepID=UPI002FC86A96